MGATSSTLHSSPRLLKDSFVVSWLHFSSVYVCCQVFNLHSTETAVLTCCVQLIEERLACCACLIFRLHLTLSIMTYWLVVYSSHSQSSDWLFPGSSPICVPDAVSHHQWGAVDYIAVDLRCATRKWARSCLVLFTVLTSPQTPAWQEFLPSCMDCRRGLAMRILSVCLSVRPSVCLSNACIVTKRKKNLDSLWIV